MASKKSCSTTATIAHNASSSTTRNTNTSSAHAKLIITEESYRTTSSSSPPNRNSNTYFKTVYDANLSEMLDSVGGIRDRPDAWREYLKLLGLTSTAAAASVYANASNKNNDRGNGQRVVRDLLSVLDVMLKTESRAVLSEIVKNNGLQMLHVIMKRCRRGDEELKKKITKKILRKVLEVVQFLAEKDVLDLELFDNEGVSRVGVESFKETIVRLSMDDDDGVNKKVNRIARKLRDKYWNRSTTQVSSEPLAAVDSKLTLALDSKVTAIGLS